MFFHSRGLLILLQEKCLLECLEYAPEVTEGVLLHHQFPGLLALLTQVIF